jgi:hypothetical protein
MNQNQLQAAYVAALAAARATPCPETRAAAVAASAALSAAIPVRKAPRSRDMSPAARSGRRQHAEQRARTAEAIAKARRA